MRAVVIADPSYARELFRTVGADLAAEIPEYSATDVITFADCFSAHFIEYYGEMDVITVMNVTDEELESHIGNYSFDVGVRCAYEVEVDRKKRRKT